MSITPMDAPPDLRAGGAYDRPPGNPGGLREAASALTTATTTTETLAEKIGALTGIVRQGWADPAGEAFEAEQHTAQSWANRVVVFAADLTPALLEYATALETQQKAWDEANAAFLTGQATTTAAVGQLNAMDPGTPAAEHQAAEAQLGQAQAATAAALEAMRAANEAAMTANEAAAASVAKAGVTSPDPTTGTKAASGLAALLLGIGDDTGSSFPADVKRGIQYPLRAASIGANFAKLYDDNLHNDLMGEPEAMGHATSETIGGAIQTFGFALVRANGVVGRGIKFGADYLVGKGRGDSEEADQNAPNIDPHNPGNPYAVGGITPNHYDTQWVEHNALGGSTVVPEPIGAPHVDPTADAFPYGPGIGGVPNR